MNTTTKSQLKIGLIILVIAAIVGLCNICIAQRTPIKPEDLLVGKSKTEVTDWVKSLNKFSESDMTITPNQQFYTLHLGKFSGPLENKLRYRYIFKSDTCRWVEITPGTMVKLDEILYDFKKVSDSLYMTPDYRIKVFVSRNGKLQALKN